MQNKNWITMYVHVAQSLGKNCYWFRKRSSSDMACCSLFLHRCSNIFLINLLLVSRPVVPSDMEQHQLNQSFQFTFCPAILKPWNKQAPYWDLFTLLNWSLSQGNSLSCNVWSHCGWTAAKTFPAMFASRRGSSSLHRYPPPQLHRGVGGVDSIFDSALQELLNGEQCVRIPVSLS